MIASSPSSVLENLTQMFHARSSIVSAATYLIHRCIYDGGGREEGGEGSFLLRKINHSCIAEERSASASSIEKPRFRAVAEGRVSVSQLER